MRLVSFSFYLSGSSIKDLDNPLRVESVPRLKQIIQELTINLDAARLSIFYSGQLMEDDRTIGHYIPTTAASDGDQESSHVAAQLVVAPEHHKVAVVVIPQETRQGELKDKICRKMGFFDVVMTTRGNGVKVDDDSAPMARFGIGEGSQVLVREGLNVSPR